MTRFFLLKSGLSIYGDGAAKYTVNSILSLRRAELAVFPSLNLKI